ncbi:hypothetical protein KKE60_04300, partial [Patescibacteria group bacterium]|nr:hypothetical protein [Patescibacteria group bacterium]
NPFVVKYFPEYHYDSLYNPDNFPNNPETHRMSGGFGISPDGKRVTWAKVKNGTTGTVVFGMAMEDTLEAAKRFSKAKVNLAIGAAPWGIAAIIAVAAFRR